MSTSKFFFLPQEAKIRIKFTAKVEKNMGEQKLKAIRLDTTT